MLFGVAGAGLLVFSSASSPVVSFETEGGIFTGAVDHIVDNAASGGGAVLFGASTPEIDSRGPDGTHWPSHTPAYITPANIFISSLSELNSALSSAQSGDVIEVAPHTFSATGVTYITNGSSSWAQNVLVRPPIGQRQSVIVDSELILNAPHVTLAGFQISAATGIYGRGDRSAFARMVVETNFMKFRNSDTGDSLEDAGIYEIVSTTPKAGDGDRMNISAVDGGKTSRFTISGIWMVGAYRQIGSASHSDTLQVFTTTGQGIEDLTIEDSVFFPSSNVSLMLDNLLGSFTIRNSWVGECETSAVSVPDGYECGGYHAITCGNSNPCSSDSTYIIDSEVYGSIYSDSAGISMNNSRALSVSGPVVGTGNTIDSGLVISLPTLPNLDDIWE